MFDHNEHIRGVNHGDILERLIFPDPEENTMNWMIEKHFSIENICMPNGRTEECNLIEIKRPEPSYNPMQFSMMATVVDKPGDKFSTPNTLKDALTSKDRLAWLRSIVRELESHDKFGSFEFVDTIPSDYHRAPLRSQFVFKVKTGEK